MSEILYSEEKSIVRITLNRPEQHNAFTAEMINDIEKAFAKATQSKTARAVVLSGKGESFCAGADLNWMKESVKFSFAENQKSADQLFQMFQTAANCPLPVIGQLHGNIMGGGLGLVAICDIALSDEQARFCFSEVRIGLAPAVISSFIARKMQPALMHETMLSGRRFTAEEALFAGLVTHTVTEDELKESVQIFTDQFMNVGPEAVKETKKLLHYLSTRPSEKEVRDYSTRVIAERRASAEGQDGLQSFFSKKKPGWVLKP